MKNTVNRISLGIATLVLITGFSQCDLVEKQKQSTPNVIYILADDLGYGDLGCYGQKKIETPNIDQLAKEGMKFTQHYAGAAVCAPSRCSLLTGNHNGKAQVRGNDPMPQRGDVQNYLAMLDEPGLEGSYPIKDTTFTLGTMFKSVGYKTAAIGKWGLGVPQSQGLPNRVGFDFFYGYICQRQAHTYYPLHLYKNDKRVYLDNDTVAPHTCLPAGADPYDLENYKPFNLKEYSPDMMMDEITSFVNENAGDPFFLYWAPTICHLPLQAPKEWVDYYVKKFGDEKPYTGTTKRGGYFPCRYPRATYAAMISYLDEQVGMLVQQLKDLGLYENTLIIFSSDNGPIGFYTPFFASASPFRTKEGYMKGTLYEGGIREPMIAQWSGVIKSGTVSGHISAFQDVMPTLADVIHADIPVEITGESFLPELLGEKQSAHDFLYWEYPGKSGSIAVRIGDYKALSIDIRNNDTLTWQLFDLSFDPQELNDISSSNADIISVVNSIVEREHVPSENPLWRYKVLGETTEKR
jgi:arylsulfatase A-like enzyme